MKISEILKPQKFGWSIITWWDRELRLWTAVIHDANDDQHGETGYGPSKVGAIDDLRYRNPEYWNDVK